MSRLTDFQAGRAPDGAGRMIGEIRRQDPRWLEARHDFIQWLFPVPETSRANDDAPLLTPADAAEIGADEALRGSLLASLDTMMGFYGIARRGTVFRRGDGFPGAFDGWLGAADHNHLRLTRILRCLSLCGLEAEAAGLRALLFEIAGAEARGQWDICLRFWRDAGSRPGGWQDGA
ncbi:hypothetical protein L2U69_12655 [Zavarzinia compransoris]|uniref:opioid growth factor receptor-related protein n=1 Tax=Zavarzinia marina TaxID=2911065 RepID=UPI001EEC7924|nr:opioid growth factor receptor-related protein [Zavarzinia marina]MCF4166496.1 hypothetical protein [Zavarzinia marina]